MHVLHEHDGRFLRTWACVCGGQAKAGELEAAKGRSGARVEHGKGIIDTFKNST